MLRRFLPYWVAVGVPPDDDFIIYCFLIKFKNAPIFVSAIFGHFGGWTDVFCRIINARIDLMHKKAACTLKLMMFKHLHFAFVGANIVIFIVQAAF